MYNNRNRQDIYYDAEEPGTAVAVPMISAPAVSHSNSRAVRKVERHAENASLAENAKAYVTKEVIVNTTALSALADMAARTVPSCERNVRNIVASYAISSANKIAETKWW